MAGVGVTVVIPTFRRADGLARVLTALDQQLDPGVPWDVLVVDNDPPGARAAFDAARPRQPARLVEEREPGPSAARNRGIAEASGTIVALLDDDVVPAPDWLRQLVAPILDDRCDGTGGRVVLDPDVPRPRWLDERELGTYLSAHEPDVVERPVTPDEYVVSSNAAFRTDRLRACGGFDPALGPQHGRWLFNDDVMLTHRFLAEGGVIRYVPGAVVVHDLPPARLRPRYLLRRSYAQGRSDWLLIRDRMLRKPLCGIGGAIGTMLLGLARRLRRGPWGSAGAFSALCSVAWTAGAVRQAVEFLGARRSGR